MNTQVGTIIKKLLVPNQLLKSNGFCKAAWVVPSIPFKEELLTDTFSALCRGLDISFLDSDFYDELHVSPELSAQKKICLMRVYSRRVLCKHSDTAYEACA